MINKPTNPVFFKGLVRIIEDFWDANIYAPIWANPIIKNARHARWSPADKCWKIAELGVAAVQHELEINGYIVRRWQRGQNAPPVMMPGPDYPRRPAPKGRP